MVAAEPSGRCPRNRLICSVGTRRLRISRAMPCRIEYGVTRSSNSAASRVIRHMWRMERIGWFR
ncbi:hypothetical protein TSO221_29610 [Azospirillum sp. TSO22-1]|nr:hypothetical protein TSO221_29610 [Azospirillum sp. TSO22-1]